MSNQQKQHRTTISDDLKYQICEWAETNKNKRHHEIASYFNERYPDLSINQSTISKILKERTDKLVSWVIGKSPHPRSFGRMNLNRLPVYYHSNPKAWMNSLLFEEILRYIDNIFRAQNKKILLLVDNAPSHFDPHDQDDNDDGINDEYDNFGKENSTSIRSHGNFHKGHAKMLKLMYDAGIIASFKAHYKQIYCHYILNLFDNGMDINRNKLTIKQAIDYIVDAWTNVLNDFFHNLDEKVSTEDFLNENDIISLIQDEMRAKNESPSHSDDSEEGPKLVSLSDA
ncbi:16662_t:CDS:2, partial [Cetraspora pellucida]